MFDVLTAGGAQDWVTKASFATTRIVDAGTCAGYRFVSAEECVYGGAIPPSCRCCICGGFRCPNPWLACTPPLVPPLASTALLFFKLVSLVLKSFRACFFFCSSAHCSRGDAAVSSLLHPQRTTRLRLRTCMRDASATPTGPRRAQATRARCLSGRNGLPAQQAVAMAFRRECDTPCRLP